MDKIYFSIYLSVCPSIRFFILSVLSGRITDNISTTPADCTNDFPEMESSHSQRSVCGSEEQPSPPKISRTQSSLLAQSELCLPFSNKLCHSPLHTNNKKSSSALRSQQRRGVCIKVKGKKSAKRMYVLDTDTDQMTLKKELT